MLDAAVSGFQHLLSLELVVLVLFAVLVGSFFGATPGVGGNLGIALLIPFVFGMAVFVKTVDASTVLTNTVVYYTTDGTNSCMTSGSSPKNPMKLSRRTWPPLTQPSAITPAPSWSSVGTLRPPLSR